LIHFKFNKFKKHMDVHDHVTRGKQKLSIISYKTALSPNQQ